MTAADLLAYVSTDGLGSTPAEETYAAACWEEATALVSRHAGSSDVPEAILNRAALEVGAELYHRRQAKNGISQFASPDGGAGIRIARDPMVAAYPILAPYVGRGIA